MVQTGMAHFGEKGQYGVLTKEDSSRLLLWALKWGFASNTEGFAIRSQFRRMMGFISAQDALMFAALASENPDKNWQQLAEELRKHAGVTS